MFEPFNHLKVLGIISIGIGIWILVASAFLFAPVNEERKHKERHTEKEKEILTDLREELVAAFVMSGVQILVSLVFLLRTLKCLKLWMLVQVSTGFAAAGCLALSIYEKSWDGNLEKFFLGSLGVDVIFSIVGVFYAYKSEEFHNSYHFEIPKPDSRL